MAVAAVSLSGVGKVISTAAARPDHAVLPLPTGIPQRGAVPQRLLTGLLERRLIAEVPCCDTAAAWRTDTKGQPGDPRPPQPGGRHRGADHHLPAAPTGLAASWVTQLARLAYLAPDIVAAILERRQPVELTANRLLQDTRLPIDWTEQRARLGFR